MSVLITSTHLLCFVFVKTARAGKKPTDTPKYEATIVIPKDHPDVARIDDAIAAVYESEKNGKFKGMPITSKNFWNPLRDGDEYLEDHPDGPEQYAGCFFIKATSTSQPKLWDKSGAEIFNVDEELYSGVFARAEIKFHPYDTESKGITVFLNALRKTKDGDKLSGGGSSSPDVFDEEEDYSEVERKAPARGGARSTTAARGAAPAKAAPARPAPKKVERIFAEDANGVEIWSEDGGDNWFY